MRRLGGSAAVGSFMPVAASCCRKRGVLLFFCARNKQGNIRRCASENAKNRPQARTFLDQISDWHLDWTYRFDLCLVVQWPDAGSRCDVRKVLHALTTEPVSNKE